MKKYGSRSYGVPSPQHVVGRVLALLDGVVPVLDADRCPVSRVVGPGDVTGCVDPGDLGLQELVGVDAACGRDDAWRGELDVRDGADAHDEQVDLDEGAVREPDAGDSFSRLDRRDLRTGQDRGRVLMVQVEEPLGDPRAEDSLEGQPTTLDDEDLAAPGAGCCGDLEADPAAADDGDPGLVLDGRPDQQTVVDGAQVGQGRTVSTAQQSAVQWPRSGAGRDQQPVVGDLAVSGADAVRLGVDGDHPLAEPQGDALVVVPGTRSHVRRRGVGALDEHRLRERGLLVRRVLLVGHDREVALPARLAQPGGGAACGGTATDDHDPVDVRHVLLLHSVGPRP